MSSKKSLNVLNCRDALAHEMGAGASREAGTRVRGFSCASRTDSSGNSGHCRKSQHATARAQSAFTLIELLAVIGVIALLAALIVPLTALAVKNMKLAKAGVELRDVETVIKNYKETKGFYPPDNPNSIATNQLFYELNGSIFDADAKAYRPMYDTNIAITSAAITTEFGVGVEGFVNSSQSLAENPVYTHNFTQKQTIDEPNGSGFKLLVCTVHSADGNLQTWHYNSTNPTNSPTSFDLWVDLVIRGKSNRICNWSTKPIIL